MAHTREFSLPDADGSVHHYMTETFPPEEGMPICADLYAALAGPAGQLLGGAVAKAKDRLGDLIDSTGEGIRNAMDDPAVAEALIDVVSGIPWGEVGKDIQSSLRSLDLAVVSRRLLRRTHRDGKPLANDVAYNEAYRANYFEHHRALWEVVKANRFFPRVSTSESNGSGPPETGTLPSKPYGVEPGDTGSIL